MQQRFILFLWLVLLASCSKAADPPLQEHAPPSWPDGTVLVVNEIPIRAVDVDALCPAVEALYPSYALPHQRRLVLTNLFLTQAAVRSRDHESWQSARARCEQDWARLQAGQEPNSIAQTYTGQHNQMGFGVWSHASLQPEGTWVGPVDLIGQWVIMRLDKYIQATQHIEVSVLEYPYIDPTHKYGATRQLSMIAARDAAHLRIIDPEWSEYVPMEWQFEMRAKE